MNIMNRAIQTKWIIGQVIRVHDTDFCRKYPEDIRDTWYYEGIITRIEPYVGSIFEVHYKITKVVCNKVHHRNSWMNGHEGRFLSDQHFIRIISNQLVLTI